MYCSYQLVMYVCNVIAKKDLSINPKKTAHKLQEIVYVNADIPETIR